jgi:hypothetical protein
MNDENSVRSTQYEESPSSYLPYKSIHVGEIKLQVRLAGDMDEKFLERLDRILNLASPR